MFKSLKKEIFYMRRVVQWGYGWRGLRRYVLNRFFSLQLLRRMQPILIDQADDFEVHILCPKGGLWMAYWTIRTFMHHSGLHPRFVVHDDGTIDEATAALFESKLSNVHILLRAEAERRFFADPSIPEVVKRYRRECKNVLLLMFVDHFFLSTSSRVLVLDNDILFYDRPTEMIEFFEGKSGLDALYAAYSDSRNAVDVDAAYKEKHAKILQDASWLNSGIMMFEKSKITTESVAEYFEHVTEPQGHLIEQTGWGLVLSQVPHGFLPESRYKLRGNVESPAVVKHFTTPRRHEMLAYGIDEARERMKA